MASYRAPCGKATPARRGLVAHPAPRGRALDGSGPPEGHAAEARRRAGAGRRRASSRESYHHGDLRRALIEAALELVRQRGVDGFTLRETARRVGVSQAAPYRHFQTKEALLAAVAEEGFRELSRRLESTRALDLSDPRRRLREQGLTCFEFYVADPARFRVMFGRASARRERYPALAEAWRSVNAPLLESLVACQRAGQFREGDPMELGLAIASMTHGLAALVIEGHLGPATPQDRAGVAELFRRAGDVLYRGLHPEGFQAGAERSGE